jgi:hypothetical protein
MHDTKLAQMNPGAKKRRRRVTDGNFFFAFLTFYDFLSVKTCFEQKNLE